MKSLISLGLPEVDAEVYMYLARKGTQDLKDLTTGLDFSQKKIEFSLKNLKSINLVFGSDHFSAIPFEKALELLIRNQHENEKTLNKLKNLIKKN